MPRDRGEFGQLALYRPVFESFHPTDWRVAPGTPLKSGKFLDIAHFPRKPVGIDGGSLHSTTESVTIPPHRVAAMDITDYVIRPLYTDLVGIVPIATGAELQYLERLGRIVIQNPGERFVVTTGRPNRMSGFIFMGQARPADTAGASIHGWIGEDGERMLQERLYVTGRNHEPPPTRLTEMGLKVEARDWTSRLAPDPTQQAEREVTVSGFEHLVELYVGANYKVSPYRIINLDLQPSA